VDDVATFHGVEAGLAGVEGGGGEALFGEGAKGAGGLQLEDGGAAADGPIGELREGDIVGDEVEGEGVGGLLGFGRGVGFKVESV
jgi:hypothetical protein